MALTVTKQETRAGVFKVHPVGSLDSDTYSILEKSIDTILKHAPTEIVLDMESVHYMSSAGIRIILKAKRDLKNQGGNLLLVNLQPPVQKVLDIINALPSLKVFASIKELDAYLDEMQRKVREMEP